MTHEQEEELKDIVVKSTWPAVEKMMAVSYNRAIDDCIKEMKRYAEVDLIHQIELREIFEQLKKTNH